MKSKLTKMLLACAVTLFFGTSVFAMTYTEMSNKLDSIKLDINDMKQEYETVLTTYPDVVNSLSAESKAVLESLTSNLMADDIKSKLNAVKAELSASTVQNADKVLAAVTDIENDGKSLLDENKDVIEEMKSSYENLTVSEAKQLVNKATEITKSLGVEKDTTTAYNSMIGILNDVHTKAKDINTAIENVLKNEEVAIKNAVTVKNIEDVFDAIKTKSQENVIDAIIKAIDGAEGTANFKNELSSLKSQAKSLKDKLYEIENLDEEAIMLFSDSQKQGVSDKIVQIEREYIDFAKKVINSYATKYLDILVDCSKTLSVDELVDKTNKLLDYYDKYKSTINDLKSGNYITSNLTTNQKNVIKKAGMLLAMDFVDINKYNKTYVNNNFNQEIKLLKDYAIDTAVDYIDYIDNFMKNEISNEVNSNTASVSQSNIKNINLSRFTTVANIDKLKTRVEGYISGHDDIETYLKQGSELLNNVYYNNILDTIEKIMLLETKKEDRNYEFDSLYYKVVSASFMTPSALEDMLGIPSGASILTATDLAGGKLKTGSMFTIKLTDTIYQTYTTVVLGDVYADGVVDARDYMAIKNQIMGKDTLSETSLAAANTYRDTTVNAQDYMKIKNQIMEKDTISL